MGVCHVGEMGKSERRNAKEKKKQKRRLQLALGRDESKVRYAVDAKGAHERGATRVVSIDEHKVERGAVLLLEP